jgi:hypothetical protein
MLHLILGGAALHSLRKKSALYLILGGAAVHRCSKCIVLNPALAAEGAALAHGRLFPQAVQRCITGVFSSTAFSR